jgi:hypothetical protein
MIYLRDVGAVVESIEIDTPSGGITKGTVQQIGNVVAFAFNDATIDSTDYENYHDTVTMVVKARQALATKATGGGSGQFDKGDKVYVIVASGLVTSTSSGNVLCGYALENAGEGDSQLLINFDGNLAS